MPLDNQGRNIVSAEEMTRLRTRNGTRSARDATYETTWQRRGVRGRDRHYVSGRGRNRAHSISSNHMHGEDRGAMTHRTRDGTVHVLPAHARTD